MLKLCIYSINKYQINFQFSIFNNLVLSLIMPGQKSIAVILFALILFSCDKVKFDEQATRPLNCDSTFFTFDKDILPIFNSNCNFSDCHVAGGRGSYDFTLYEVAAGRVRAGTMDYRLDLPFDDPQHMPEKMQLSACDFYIIKTWIKQGFVKN